MCARGTRCSMPSARPKRRLQCPCLCTSRETSPGLRSPPSGVHRRSSSPPTNGFAASRIHSTLLRERLARSDALRPLHKHFNRLRSCRHTDKRRRGVPGYELDASRGGRSPAMSLVDSALDPRLKSVLIATDLSPVSAKPLHHALGMALHYGAKLYVAHVVSTVPYLIAGPQALAVAYEGASQSIQQLQSDLLHDDSAKGLDCEFIIRYGRVWEQLHAIIYQKQIDLIVVGTDARRGIEKVLLGSVAEQVFRDASCPVLTVGPHSYQESRVDLTGEIRTYLFATDFGETSLRALPQAVSLASQTNAGLILLHVVPAAPVPQIQGWYSASEIVSMR